MNATISSKQSETPSELSATPPLKRLRLSDASPTQSTAAMKLHEARMWALFKKKCEDRCWRRGCSQCTMLHNTSSTTTEAPAVLARPQPWRQLSLATATPAIATAIASASSGDTEDNAQKLNAIPLVTVDPKMWNTYWQTYSDKFGGVLDALDSFLRDDLAHPNPGSTTHVPNRKWSSAYRRVVIHISKDKDEVAATHDPKQGQDEPKSLPEAEPSSSLFTHPTLFSNGSLTDVTKFLDNIVVPLAMIFGAVEYSEYANQQLLWIQFTTAEAALMFLEWASGLPLIALAEAYASEMVTLANAPSLIISDAFREAMTGSSLSARLAPSDNRRISRCLLLGPRLMLSTPFVNSLFKGMFDARDVVYSASMHSFVLTFDSADAARFTLHALQYSLWKVFHLPLVFLLM